MSRYDFVSGRAVLGALNRQLDVGRFNRLQQKRRDSSKPLNRRESQYLFDGNVRLLLRTYVDEWLKTGRHADSSETPLRRTLLKTDKAKRAPNLYLEKHPFNVIFDPDLNISVSAPSQPPKSVTAGPEMDLARTSTERADFLFVGMLASEWKHQLFRCRHCGEYKLLKRAPRRRYKHGMFCRVHQQAWTAARFTRARRQRAKSAAASGRQKVTGRPESSSVQPDRSAAPPSSASNSAGDAPALKGRTRSKRPARPTPTMKATGPSALGKQAPIQEPPSSPSAGVSNGPVASVGGQLLLGFADPVE